MDILLIGIVILLLILFFVSFMMFIRRMVINQEAKHDNTFVSEEKLDKIIELLEKEKVDK